MPGCKPSFKKVAAGKKIGGGGPSIGAYGMEIHAETAYFGGNTGPIMSKRVEVAAPLTKRTTGTGKSGGMFG